MKKLQVILECLLLCVISLAVVIGADCSPILFGDTISGTAYGYIQVISRVFILFILVLLLILNRERLELNKYVVLNIRMNWRMFFALIVLSIGFYVIKHPIYFFDSLVNYGGSTDLHFTINNQQLNWSVIVTMVILTPIFEELLFRGYIFTRLRKEFNIVTAITINCILFSLVHLPDVSAAVNALLLGVISCLLMIWTRTIVLPILLHFSVNLFWYIGAYHFKLNNLLLATYEIKFVYISTILIAILFVTIPLVQIYKRRVH